MVVNLIRTTSKLNVPGSKGQNFWSEKIDKNIKRSFETSKDKEKSKACFFGSKAQRSQVGHKKSIRAVTESAVVFVCCEKSFDWAGYF